MSETPFVESHRLPAPLAELVSALQRTGDEFPSDRERLASALIEGLVLHWAFVLGAAVHHYEARTSTYDAAFERVRGLPTLGEWVQYARAASEALADASVRPSVKSAAAALASEPPPEVGDFLDRFRQLAPEKTGDAPHSVLDAFRQIKDYRNKKAHGGAAWLEMHLGLLAAPLADAAFALVAQATWLVETSLVRVRTAMQQEDGTFVHDCDVLNGEAPRRERLNAPQRFTDGATVFDPKDAAVVVAPFYLALPCPSPHCRGSRLFGIARDFESKPGYLHQACGTEIVQADAASAWQGLVKAAPRQRREVVIDANVEPRGRAVSTGEEFQLRVHVQNLTDEPIAGLRVEPTVPAQVTWIKRAPLERSTLPPGGSVDLNVTLVCPVDGRLTLPGGRVRYALASGREVVRPLPEHEVLVMFDDFPRLVGRDAEMDILREAWLHARTGHARFAVFSGPSGTGKTAIVRTFRDEVSKRGTGAIVLWTRCYEEDLHPLAAFADLLRRYLLYYVDRAELDRIAAETLRWSVSDLMRQNVLVTDVLAIVARVIGGWSAMLRRDVETNDYAAWAEASRRTELYAAVSDAFAAIASRFPLVLYLENLHLLHRDGWTLLRYLVRQLARQPVLVLGCVGAHTPGEDAPDGVLPQEDVRTNLRKLGFQIVNVAPLGPAAMGELFDALVPGHQIEQPQRASILDFSQGLPSWLVETMHVLRTRRHLVYAEGHWRLKEKDLVVSQAFSDVIRQRYEALDAPLRRVIDNAAILGKRFARDVLAQFATEGARGDVIGVNALLRQLREIHHILREESEDVLVFSHVRVHDIIYSQIDAGARQALHRYVAEMLERRVDPDAYCLEIAFHLVRGGEDARALDYLEKSARRLEESMAYDEARRTLERALKIVDGHPALRSESWRFDVVRRLARVHWLNGDTEASIQLDLANIQRALTLGRFSDACDVYRIVSMTRDMQGKYDEAWMTASAGLELATSKNLEKHKHTLSLQLGLLARQRRHFDEAERLLDDVRQWAAAHEQPWMEAEVNRQLGILYRMRGEVSIAREFFERSCDLFDAMPGYSRHLGLGMVYDNMAALSQQIDDLDSAAVQLHRSLAERREARDGIGLGRGLYGLAKLEYLRGRMSEALARLNESLQIKQRMEDGQGLAKCHELRGEIMLELDRWVETIESFEEAQRIYARLGLAWDAAHAALRMAATFLATGRMGRARELAAEVAIGLIGVGDSKTTSELWLLRAELEHDGDRAVVVEAEERLSGIALPAYQRARFDSLLVDRQLGLGTTAEALELARARLDEVRRNPHLAVRYLKLLARAQRESGGAESALATLSEAQALVNASERPAAHAAILHEIGETLARLGRLDEAVRRFKTALDLQQAIGDEVGSSRSSDALRRLQSAPSE